MLCRYCYPGYKDGGGFEFTCRKPDRRPEGLSWEKCEKEYCPYFGAKGKNVKTIIDGKVIATAESIKFVMSSEGEQGSNGTMDYN